MMCSFVVVLREKGAVVFRAYSNAHTTRKGIEREVTERKIFQKRASSMCLGFICYPKYILSEYEGMEKRS